MDKNITKIIKFFKFVLISDISQLRLENIIAKCMKINTSLYKSTKPNYLPNTNSLISHRAVAALVKCGDPRNKSIDGVYPYYVYTSPNTLTGKRVSGCDLCSYIMDESSLSFSITLEKPKEKPKEKQKNQRITIY